MSTVFVKNISHDNISTAIHQLLDQLQLERLLANQQTVILKPNFVAPRKSFTGATTHLEIIEQVVIRLQQMEIRPLLFEMPGMEYDVYEVFEFLGIFQWAQKLQLDVFIPQESDYQYFPIPNGKRLKKAKIPKILNYYPIINLPIMKTHVITGVTLGIKNLMGFCHNDTRKQMHIRGIQQTVADLYHLIKPAMTILDGWHAMEGDGAVYGNTKPMNLLLGSTDTAALDVVACSIMGIDAQSIQHIQLSQFQEPINTVGSYESQPFQQPQQGKWYQFCYRMLYVIDLVFEKCFHQHFNQFLYKTGRFGTHPRIQIKSDCSLCRQCIDHCPVTAIAQDFSINPQKCLRCLTCYDLCPQHRIHVNGFSSPEHPNS